MASKINADEFVDREGEGKPTLPKGVVLSGVTTITTAVVAENEVANSTGINVGIITSTHFAGNLTGDVNAGIVTVTSQSVIGSAVTISASGIDIGAGVITATSYAGSGANLTGIGLTIAPISYNPDVSESDAALTGIGLTFNQRVSAGTGNDTLSLVAVGSTLVENFSVGSSVTYNNDADPPNITITPTNSLSADTVYAINYPPGAFTQSGAGGSFVGTAYTVYTKPEVPTLWSWGYGVKGSLGLNQSGAGTYYSSPVQVPGTTWSSIATGDGHVLGLKTDGTLWAWGQEEYGQGGHNNLTKYSSPAQIPGTTWSKIRVGQNLAVALKTDGSLWAWGNGYYGGTGQNLGESAGRFSSPVQIGTDTDWSLTAQYLGAGGPRNMWFKYL